MFSIIIPTLNEESIIEKAINQFSSIKNKYNIEIIVSDSGSSDQTVSIARNISDKVVIYENDNCNISKARNLGAEHAKNKILVFMDADILIKDTDYFFKIIADYINKDNVSAISPRISIYPDQEKIQDKCIHFVITLISNILNGLGLSYSRGGCQIIHKKNFDRISGYNEAFVAAEDVDIFRRLRKLGKTMIVNNLHVYESPRRYRKKGYLIVLYFWLMNWIYTLFFNKSFSTKW